MVSTPQKTAQRTAESFSAPRQRTRREKAFQYTLLVATVISLFVLALLLFDILTDGVGRLRLDFLTRYTSRFADETGIRAGLYGTISLMVIVAALAFPIGVGAAIYLEEFAPENRWTRLLETNISNLAGVPSVVYGLLGLGVFAFVLGLGRTLLVGALTLTLLVLPVIIVASRESLRAVPQAIREAGLALGATPLQVTFKQVVPAALPGMLTGTILALSRAIGETAPILVAGAALSAPPPSAPLAVRAASPAAHASAVAARRMGCSRTPAGAGVPACAHRFGARHGARRCCAPVSRSRLTGSRRSRRSRRHSGAFAP